MRIYLLKRKGKLSKESEQKGRSTKISLYLMYHFGAGQKREYEFLNLYLYDKPKNQIEKDHNKQTYQLAETIKAKRLIDAQTSAHGFISRVKSRLCFVAYFKKLVDKKESDGNRGNWRSTYQHLLTFTNNKELPLEKVDERFLETFKDYLLSCQSIKGKGNSTIKLNRNTALSYFNKVRAALREAYNHKLIKENPATRVKCIKGQDTHREFLTLEELQQLAQTDCELPVLKKLFLTSALTGLRYSDLKNLRWDNIQYSEQNGYSIKYVQQKTKKAEVLPIAEHVVTMLGDKGVPEDLIFKGYIYNAWNNLKLKQWVLKAGITKTNITLHCARHSYACLQLSMGTDITIISRLLGHANIKTTQIYTKVLDRHKIEAANRIPQLMTV